MAQTPIANKYREGKMQRTLKRELKVPEIAKGEPVVFSHVTRSNQCFAGKARRLLHAYGCVVKSFGRVGGVCTLAESEQHPCVREFALLAKTLWYAAGSICSAVCIFGILGGLLREASSA